MDDIQTTETDYKTMETEAPKPKKAAKKAAKTTLSITDQARDRVKAKLLAANRLRKTIC